MKKPFLTLCAAFLAIGLFAQVKPGGPTPSFGGSSTPPNIAYTPGRTGAQATTQQAWNDAIPDCLYANNRRVSVTGADTFSGRVFNRIYNTAGNVETSGTAAPTTGTWLKGDHCINSNSTVGSPKGWYCSTAGTPGTWTSEGNL